MLPSTQTGGDGPSFASSGSGRHRRARATCDPFEISFTDERGFMGILWRLQDADNYEEFYVRPHQSGNPDANQNVTRERTWSRLESEDSGLANLGRVNARGDGRNAAFARVKLEASREQTVGLRFGYSDLVRVYLYGRLLYAGDNGYRSRDYRYLGTIGYFDELFLPLKPGGNQLGFAVAESFGGWGLQAALPGAEGVTVRPHAGSPSP